MMIVMPKYLSMADIQDDSIRYAWDDWNEEQAEKVLDQELKQRLHNISKRAVLAFMCGSAEWIVHRYEKIHDNTLPLLYLEAAWAMTVSVRYSGYGGVYWVDFNRDQWTGPIRRPIAKAFDRVEGAIQELEWEGADPVNQAVLLSSLAIYIMNDKTAYKHWCDQVMDRFEAVYPLIPDDPLGDVVPRQAIDPDYDFKIEKTELLINEFLAGLDYSSNIFLSPPEGMLEIYDEDEGFSGTPYQFDIASDRKSRRRQIY